MKIYHKQIESAVHCVSVDSGDIFDDKSNYLKLKLPIKNTNETQALITLNIPRPYAKGTNWPGIIFEISRFVISEDPKKDDYWDVLAWGSCTYEFKKPGTWRFSRARMPITVTAAVDLEDSEITVAGRWRSVRGAEGIIDSPVSISAIIGEGMP